MATTASATTAAVFVHPTDCPTGSTPAPVSDYTMRDAGGTVELHQGLTGGIAITHLPHQFVRIQGWFLGPWAQVAKQDRMGTPELSGDSSGGHSLIPEGASGAEQIVP